MPSSYASPFDDLLANNEKQMDEVMGGSSNTFSKPVEHPVAGKRPSRSMPQEQSRDPAGPATISGTANGVTFTLRV